MKRLTKRNGIDYIARNQYCDYDAVFKLDREKIKKEDVKYYIEEKQTGICLFEPHSFNKLYFDTIEDAKQHLIKLGENVGNYIIKEWLENEK